MRNFGKYLLVAVAILAGLGAAASAAEPSGHWLIRAWASVKQGHT